MSIDIKTSQDEQHLNLLSIFHYVLAGLFAFGGCIPLVHVALGIGMMTGALDQGPNPPPAFGLIFAGVGGTISLLFWSLAVLGLFAGRFLARRTHYRFCFIVACIECIQVPKGTLLGVFTILVLSRPSVKAIFEDTPDRNSRMDSLKGFQENEHLELPPQSNEPRADGAIQAAKRPANGP